MALTDRLSTLKQRLIASIPVNLGVRQYQTVMLVHEGSTYTFTAKVTEPSPSTLVNFLGLGVDISSDYFMLQSIPFNIPLAAIRYGLFTLADGVEAESKYILTTGTVDYSCLVHLFRSRA